LMNESDEFVKTKGLGLISGKVKALSEYSDCTVPHIGWEEVSFRNNLFENRDFFFCHSYVADLEHEENILATAKCGKHSFCAAAQKDNILGFQFHPEKSAKPGIQLIERFVDSI